MIVIDNTIISDDVVEELFLCDVERCKGACCVEGDLGAPLTEEELVIIPGIYHYIKPYLSEKGNKTLKKKGFYIKDWQGDFSTPTIRGKECAYAIYDEKGILKCGIEKAFDEGKIDFKKPVSCHLYPVRLTEDEKYTAVNYDRWLICSSACAYGIKMNVPLYKFLKEAFIRRFGEEWYEKLETHVSSRTKPDVNIRKQSSSE